ncbi:alpha/beta hydrolase [Microbacterium sp. NPDC096154]|uniref:alpha/beta fold hydrolase n=1 Tax=Microbacterium sp. NPDC096154 TaxID=3155549 RepID=UPI00332B45B7
MNERIRAALGAPEVAALVRGATIAFELAGDSWSFRMRVEDGAMAVGGEPRFVLRAADAVWEGLLASEPVAGEQSIVHLVRTARVVLHGDQDAYIRHLHVVRAVLDAARGGRCERFAPSRPLDARGEYRRVSSALGTADVYVESAGSGPVLLALATAGSDTTQWHGVMTETDLLDRWRLVTVDLPWHGRSSPAFDVPVGGWTLTPASYTDFIVAIADALELTQPILVGASMAGAAVVHAIASHPDRFAGGVACQAGRGVRNRADPALRATDVNPSLFVPEWTYGLMNPASPAEFRKRVWWGYSSGGFGLYGADIDSYLQWDFAEVAGGLTPSSPHVAVLSGSYDTTVPPAASRELAEAIPNASFEEMRELGHFPHAENPAVFARYLEAALARVASGRPG